MRTLIARIFDYSLDGVIATEGTSFFGFCRELPDDEALLDHTRAFYEQADLHIMGRKSYVNAAQYFPDAVDHPYADAMNAARKVVFSHTITSVDWANTSVANGDLAAEIEKLKLDGDGYIVAHGGLGFLRSLIRADLIDEYRITLFPYLAVTGARLFDDLDQPAEMALISATAFGDLTELAFRRPRLATPADRTRRPSRVPVPPGPEAASAAAGHPVRAGSGSAAPSSGVPDWTSTPSSSTPTWSASANASVGVSHRMN